MRPGAPLGLDVSVGSTAGARRTWPLGSRLCSQDWKKPGWILGDSSQSAVFECKTWWDDFLMPRIFEEISSFVSNRWKLATGNPETSQDPFQGSVCPWAKTAIWWWSSHRRSYTFVVGFDMDWSRRAYEADCGRGFWKTSSSPWFNLDH